MGTDHLDSDLHLVKACIEGNPAAWEKLRALLHRLARWLNAADTSSVQDVEDLVQDVCEILVKDDYRALRSYDPNLASLPTFLMSILIRRKKRHERARRNTPLTVSLMEEIISPAEGGTWARYMDVLVFMDLAKRVLPELDMLILGWYAEGFSFAEISALLERLYDRPFSVAAVRKRKERAVKRMRRFLDRQKNPEDAI